MSHPRRFDYPAWLVSAFERAGIHVMGSPDPRAARYELQPSETDIEVARMKVAQAMAKAECNSARVKLRVKYHELIEGMRF